MKIIINLVLICLVSGTIYGQNNKLKVLLDSIREESKKNNSTSLLIQYKGKLLLEDYDGDVANKPENIQSITKVISNLAIGKLLTDGKIDSLDIPIYKFYPELNQGKKKNITLRQILNHTSGLDNNNYDDALEKISMIQVALCSELIDFPGDKMKYNNVAINLVVGIIEKVSKKKFDKFINEEIFLPIGIENVKWFKDGNGDAIAYGGCMLTPKQLLKFGEFARNKGNWRGKELISKKWFDIATPLSGTARIFGQKGVQYSSPLTWFLITNEKTEKYYVTPDDIKDLKKCGLEDRIIKPFENIESNKSISGDVFWSAFEQAISEPTDNRVLINKLKENNFAFPKIDYDVIGYYHTGGGGQYLYIYPEMDLIIVRTVSEKKIDKTENKSGWTDLKNVWINKLIDEIEK